MASEIMRVNGVWRLGIHGVRGAGKTCYLAALYGFRAQENGAVGFADEETIDYLSDKWDHYLAKGQKPKPTAMAMPSELRCHVKAEQRVWQVVLRDYAGELVQRKGGDDVIELRDETLEWLKECNAILFFLDITEPENAIRERLNELDLLLTELHKLSAGGNTIARPLSLVLTKWDSRTDFDVIHADPAAELEKARCFLKNDSVFGQFHAALGQSADRIEVFPVSAFGSHRDGQLPPPNGPQQAFNIHAPLVWSVTKAEEMVAQKAERDADRLLGHRWWPRYAAAIDVLRKVIEDYRLTTGSAYAKLAERIRTLNRKLWWRRAIVLMILIVVVLSARLFTLFNQERMQYQSVIRSYDDPSIGSIGIKAQTEQYLARNNIFKRLFKHEDDVRNRWAQRQAVLSQRDYDNLEEYRRKASSEPEATSRLEKDIAYLAVWEGDSKATIVSGWKLEDAAAADKYQKRVAHESRYQGMLEDVAALVKGSKYAEAVEAYRRFLSDYPESSFRIDVEKRISDMETANDDHNWKQVVDCNQENPNNYQETIKQAEQYITSPTAKHRSEAEALVTRTEDRWDWAMYEQIRDASRTGVDANTIESVRRKATVYMTGTQPRKRMKAEVQKWLDWFNGFQTDKDYYVVVRSLEIPPGSDLDESNPCCKVKVSVNGTSCETGWAEGKNPVFGKTLGPYKFKWGQGTFSVRVEEHDYDSPNDVAEFLLPETDERFIISRLNGPVAVRDRNGKNVMVYLECDTVRPPELPAYKDK